MNGEYITGNREPFQVSMTVEELITIKFCLSQQIERYGSTIRFSETALKLKSSTEEDKIFHKKQIKFRTMDKNDAQKILKTLENIKI